MKLPLLKAEYSMYGWVISILLGAACLIWRNSMLPGWEFAAGIFLIGLAILLGLFSNESSKSTTQFGVLVFVIGTAILLLAARFQGLMDGIIFGPSLIVFNAQLGILSGLLWLLPVLTTFQFTARYSENIYLRSLLGASLVLAASVLMLQTSEHLMLLFWRQEIMSWKAVIAWFVGAFFFHFAGIQMQVKITNPIAFRLFLTYLGFFAIQEGILLIRSIL